MLDVTPDIVSDPVAPAVIVEGMLTRMVPDKVGVTTAAVTDWLHEPVTGPLLALGDVLALMVKLYEPVGVLAAAVTVIASLAAIFVDLLNVKYDWPLLAIL